MPRHAEDRCVHKAIMRDLGDVITYIIHPPPLQSAQGKDKVDVNFICCF